MSEAGLPSSTPCVCFPQQAALGTATACSLQCFKNIFIPPASVARLYLFSSTDSHAVHTFTFPVSPALLCPLAQVLASTLGCDGQMSPLENLEKQLKPLGLGSGDGQWLSVSSQALAGWTSMDASPGGSWSPQVSMETLLLPILRTRPSASMGTTVLRTPGSLTTGPQRGAPCVGWG